MSKIQSIEICAAKVPIAEPHRTSSVVVDVCPLVLITVQTDAGVKGHGIAFTYSDVFLKPVLETASAISPLYVGQLLEPAAVTNQIVDRFKLLGTQGMMGMVLGAFDMALWDAKSRLEGVALNALLGGEIRPVKPYGNIGYDGVRGSAEAAEKLAKRGFLGIKAKIGYPTVGEDLEVIRAMRNAAGPDVALMVDYNQSLTLDEARLRFEQLASEDLIWIEEPVHSHDLRSYVELQETTSVPLQAGENWWGPLDFQIAFDAGVRQQAMPDAQKCLGVTGWMQIAEMASKLNVDLSSHLWPEVSAQLLSVTPTGAWLEYMDWFNPILKEPLRLKNGFADIDGVIGTGMEFNAEAVEHFRL